MTNMNNSYLAWAEIDLNALSHNLNLIRSQLKTGTKIMAVVKSNAYGHGAVETSKVLIEYGVDALAVATVQEGAELRRNKILAPVLILSSIAESEMSILFEQHLIPTINTADFAYSLNDYGRQNGKRISVHIRVDTGMGSYGLMPDECLELVRNIGDLGFLDLGGIYTHLNAMYGGAEEDTRAQIAIFNYFINQMELNHLHTPMYHACSSPSILKMPEAEYDMVRSGISLYGLPCGNEMLDDKVYPVMQIKAKVVAIKAVGRGCSLGYGWNFKTSKPAQIATIPLGYADAGFLHFIAGGEVLIHGQRVPIIGRPCMDHLIVDVSEINDIVVGDEAVLLGTQGNQCIKAEDIAVQSGVDINNLDVICLLGPRVARVYKR